MLQNGTYDVLTLSCRTQCAVLRTRKFMTSQYNEILPSPLLAIGPQYPLLSRFSRRYLERQHSSAAQSSTCSHGTSRFTGPERRGKFGGRRHVPEKIHPSFRVHPIDFYGRWGERNKSIIFTKTISLLALQNRLLPCNFRNRMNKFVG